MAFKQRDFKRAVLISMILAGSFQALAKDPLPEESTSSLAELVQNEIASAKGIDFWSSLSNGMVARELKADGKLIGGKDSKTMFSTGDIVYLVLQNESPTSPNEWVLFRKVKKVYHPKTGEFMGDLIEITGTAKAIGSRDHTIIGQIVHSKEVISLQDEMIGIGTLMRTASPSESIPSVKKEGTIIEVRDNRLNNAEQDIVYIDRGRRDGLLPGHQFEVLHGGQKTSQATFPPRRAGRLVIVSTQDQTATAQIIESSEPISKGDPILFLPKQ